jgi:hypothetical protein
VNSSSTPASSILRPLYCTTTRSAVSATTPDIVGDHDQSHAVLALQPHQQVEDLLLDGDVERRGRLVGDQQLGVAGDRHGDHHALVLAARHLVRERMQPLFGLGDTDLMQQFDGAGAALGPPHAEMEAQHFLDLETDGEARIEAGHRLLEDHGHIAADDLAALCRAHASAGRARRIPSGRR